MDLFPINLRTKLIDSATFSRKPDRIIIERRERIKREGSKPFVWETPATAAAAASFINIGQQFPEARKYQPLDYIRVINNEPSNDIKVKINGEAVVHYVPAKTILELDNQSVWTVEIENKGAVITTAGKIIVSMEKQALTADALARRQG